MSVAERFIRITCNELPENEDDAGKLKTIIKLLLEPLLEKKNHYTRRDIDFLRGSFSIRRRKNGEFRNGEFDAIDSDTGDKIKLFKDANSAIAVPISTENQSIDIAIIKSILEEKKDMSLDDFENMIQSNAELSDFLVSYPLSLLKERPELKNLYINKKAVDSNGNPTQDAIEISALQELYEEYFQAVAPLGDFGKIVPEDAPLRPNNIYDSSAKMKACKILIEDIIAGNVASAMVMASKGRIVMPKVLDTLKSGLITSYKQSERQTTAIGEKLSDILASTKHTASEIGDDLKEIGRSEMKENALSEILNEHESKDNVERDHND